MLYFMAISIWILSSIIGHSTSSQSKVVIVNDGDNVEFYCPEKLSSQEELLDWYLNNSLVNRTVHGRLDFSTGRNLIHINNVHSDDAGTWAVKPPIQKQSKPQENVDAIWIQNWCNFTLQILDGTKLQGDQHQHDSPANQSTDGRPPRFKKVELMRTNQNMTKTDGESVTFKCDVYGYPTPFITWSKNGQNIFLHGSLKRRKWWLKLDTISKEDSGQYTCTVSNIHGSLNFTYSLTVQDVPKKPKLPGIQNVTVRTGDTVRLNCSMAPQGRLSHVEWLRHVEVNGSFVDSTGAPFFDVLDVDSEGRDRRILSIENVTTEDNGRYFCVLKSKFESSIQSAWVVSVDVEEFDQQNRRVYLASVAGVTGGIVVILSFASAFIMTKRSRNDHRDSRETRIDNNPSVLSCGDPNSPIPCRLNEDTTCPVKIS